MCVESSNVECPPLSSFFTVISSAVLEFNGRTAISSTVRSTFCLSLFTEVHVKNELAPNPIIYVFFFLPDLRVENVIAARALGLVKVN